MESVSSSSTIGKQLPNDIVALLTSKENINRKCTFSSQKNYAGAVPPASYHIDEKGILHISIEKFRQSLNSPTHKKIFDERNITVSIPCKKKTVKIHGELNGDLRDLEWVPLIITDHSYN